MAINYVITKKVSKYKEGTKELYYASSKALQKRGQGVDEQQIAWELADRSSLTKGDVLSVLAQLSDRISHHLKEGRTVNIQGIGTFMAAITSEGCETIEECTADKVRVSRICFKADKELSEEVKKAKFISLQLKVLKGVKKR